MKINFQNIKTFSNVIELYSKQRSSILTVRSNLELTRERLV